MKITNERQYEATKRRLEDPEAALAEIEARRDLSPATKALHRDALLSNLESLALEIQAYERKRDERPPTI
jgi:hypothetical protein